MFDKVNVNELNLNIFNKFDKECGLVVVGDENVNNAMTISWGSVGVMWNKKVVTVFIRPTRYTYNLIKNADNFTLCFFDESKRAILNYCGTKSGKDVNKMKELNLSPIKLDNTLAIDEANFVFVLKTIATYRYDNNGFKDQGINKFYSTSLNDYHYAFVGEIIGAYRK